MRAIDGMAVVLRPKERPGTMRIDILKIQDGFLVVRNLHLEADTVSIEGGQTIPPDQPYRTWDSAWNQGMWSTVNGEPFRSEEEARAFIFANKEMMLAAPEA